MALLPMAQALRPLHESPSQTAGPYVHIGCTPNAAGIEGVFPADLGASMKTGPVRGEEITIRGRVLDGFGAPLRDAVVEVWQADAEGRFAGQDGADPHFAGWGRSAGDPETGEFAFETVRPGPVPYPDGRMQAPHVTLWIVARGINVGLHTRMYLPGDEAALARDPVLSRIEPRERAATMVGAPDGPGAYRLTVRLQGDGETVFLDM